IREEDFFRGKPIFPMEKLEPFIREHSIRLGIITVPKAAAQKVADQLVAAGIRGIWNFANAQIAVPPTVVVKNVDLAASLALLSGELVNLLQKEE
ncbi:MAG: redox-sensing transcriptional repressor Rex, partial [Christensenellaceae bacterium]